MTDRADLAALADRVERLSGPDRHVNLAIANAIYGDDLAPPGTNHNYTASGRSNPNEP